MFTIKKILRGNIFLKNIMTLIMGAGIAQAIPLAISPILTRIYTPDHFGKFAIYMTIASILGAVGNLRYELAIVLPQKDEDSISLMKLSLLISSVFSVIVFLIVLLWGKSISLSLGNKEIYNWLFILPISIFLMSLYQNLSYWETRKKQYKIVAGSKIFLSSGTGASQIGFNYVFNNGLGLVFGNILGHFCAISYYIKEFISEGQNILLIKKAKNLKEVAIQYIAFPKLDVPTTVLNLGSTHAPNILFTTFFQASYSGFYYLTIRVLQAPISLISTSVLDVFKVEATESFQKQGNAKKVYLKTVKMLTLISIIPFTTLFFFIEDIFAFVFGSEWIMAGTYAKILLPAIAIRFVSNPLSFMIYIANKQFVNLVTMVILGLCIVLTFMIADSHLTVIKLLSISYFIYYSWHLIYSAYLAKVF